ncbi:MAG: hypothetical protein EA368_03995 [Leptolyngbya sp. DLM2.Bin27]|nr:MAG: hypothetical protein EA368_03995 [Leptolyngbya sp. DLM2.Bin27]
MVSLSLKTKTLIALLALGAAALQVTAVACSVNPGPGPAPEQSVTPSPAEGETADIDQLLTPEVRDRILQTVAAEVDRPAAALDIVAAETATWDGCMGIYEPNQMCTMIAISGLRLVVTDGDQSWVYHAHQDGQTMVQNPTAVSRNGLIPDFIPPQPQPQPEPEDHLFRSVESGGLAGIEHQTVLLADGRLLKTENSTVVAETQVTPAELATFQQVLEDQRFPNLHRLRYVTAAAFADYPTVQLSARHYQTHYIDLAIDDAPPALQAVVQAWEDLTAQVQ